MEPALYVSGCRSFLGEIHDIGELALDAQTRDALKQKNLRKYSDMQDYSVPTLAIAAIRKTLAAAEIPPGAVDAVVLCTSSYWYHDQLTPQAIGLAFCEADLAHSDIVMTSVMGCHNAVTGFRIARNLIRSEDVENVIVVTADILNRDGTRLSDGLTLLGDGAASCLISAGRRGEYRLLDVMLHDNHRLHRYSNTGPTAQLFYIEWLRSAAKVSKELLARNGMGVRDLKVVIPNNYSAEISQRIADAMEIDAGRLIPFNPTSGHVWSSDVFIGLERVDRHFDVDDGDRIMMLGTGQQNFGAILLEKVRS